jgi:hypothetical protein
VSRLPNDTHQFKIAIHVAALELYKQLGNELNGSTEAWVKMVAVRFK